MLVMKQGVGVNMDLSVLEKIEELEGRIVLEIKELKENNSANQLSLESIASDDSKAVQIITVGHWQFSGSKCHIHVQSFLLLLRQIVWMIPTPISSKHYD